MVFDSPYTYNPRPSASGASRQNVGGFGVVRLLTPSGEICTRRSDSSAATAAATGTPTSIARYPQAVGVSWDSKYRVPISAAPASAGRTSRKMTTPRTAPQNALTTDSTDAITRMSAGVPPTRRSAANRSSRRSAASRVAVLISTSIGNSTASTPTPNAYRKNGVNTSDAGAVEIEVTHGVPGTGPALGDDGRFGSAPSAAGVYPM